MKRVFLAFIVIFALSFVSGAWAAPGDTPDDPIIIRTAAELDAVRNGLEKYYRMGNDIDLTAYLAPGGQGYAKWGDEGWLPIGTSSILVDDHGNILQPDLSVSFRGSFDGDGNKISGMWIDRNEESLLGLFGAVASADIKNLGVEIADRGLMGGGGGGLVGFMFDGSNIGNSYATGDVSGVGGGGGLVGVMFDGSKIDNSYATGNVSGDRSVGGLVGFQYPLKLFSEIDFVGFTIITNSYATGNVTASEGIDAGGLVGGQFGGNIINSYATGNVLANEVEGFSIGGLVGSSYLSFITNSYATGNVRGYSEVGGLLGMQAYCNIENSYATGNVSGNHMVGGLVGGRTGHFSNIENSYTTGAANRVSSIYGLVGIQGYSNTENSYATDNVSGYTGVRGLVGWQHNYSFDDPSDTIKNSYATGNIRGNIDVGGLVGYQGSGNYEVIITNSYRYQNATINGVVLSENTPNGRNGGIKTSAELMTKATYTSNSWLFNDTVPTAGPWHWDISGYPKLNMGTEPWPWPWSQQNGQPTITITTQPTANSTVTAGNITGSLSVGASVTQGATLNYQWYSNNTNSNTGGTSISGATSSSFPIPTNLAAGTYYYYCVVSATGAASVTSNVARVTVNDAPIITPVITITSQPAVNTTVTAGNISVSLSVGASVTQGATLNYQWYSNITNNNTGGTSISGATSSSFTIPTNLTAGTYYYYCVVSATGAASVPSSVARVTVNDAPIVTPVITITSQPTANTTVTEGSISGSLSVGASVTPSATLNYQWYSNTSNSNTGGTSISSATSYSFPIPTNLSVGTYYYYCVTSATGAASVTSNVARVTVEEGSGCNVIYYGYLVFALFGVMPFVLKRRQ